MSDKYLLTQTLLYFSCRHILWALPVLWGYQTQWEYFTRPPHWM